jgi:hypothetical protein
VIDWLDALDETEGVGDGPDRASDIPGWTIGVATAGRVWTVSRGVEGAGVGCRIQSLSLGEGAVSSGVAGVRSGNGSGIGTSWGRALAG